MEKQLGEENKKLNWFEEFQQAMEEMNIQSVMDIFREIEKVEGNETQEAIDEINNKIKHLTLTTEEELAVYDRFKGEVKSLTKSSDATDLVRSKLKRKTRLLENRIKRAISKEFGAYIKEIRDRNGYSLKEVEEMTKISASYINRIEKGERNAPSYPIIEKLAQAYNVPVHDLLKSAGLNVESKAKNLNSFSQLIFTNNFTLNGRIVSAEEKELILKLIDKLDRVQWSEKTKHIDTIDLIKIIDDFKELQKQEKAN